MTDRWSRVPATCVSDMKSNEVTSKARAPPEQSNWETHVEFTSIILLGHSNQFLKLSSMETRYEILTEYRDRDGLQGVRCLGCVHCTFLCMQKTEFYKSKERHNQQRHYCWFSLTHQKKESPVLKVEYSSNQDHDRDLGRSDHGCTHLRKPRCDTKILRQIKLGALIQDHSHQSFSG